MTVAVNPAAQASDESWALGSDSVLAVDIPVTARGRAVPLCASRSISRMAGWRTVRLRSEGSCIRDPRSARSSSCHLWHPATTWHCSWPNGFRQSARDEVPASRAMTKRAHTGKRLVWSAARLGVLVVVASPAAAQPQPLLRLDPAGAAASAGARTPLEALPGVSFTLVFRVTNMAAVNRAVDIRVDVPTGWQVLFASDRLSLSPQASSLETVSIVPPRTAEAGEYTIRFDATAVGEPVCSASVAVRIPTRHGLRLAWDDAPSYLAAGTSTSLGLTITNDGNLVENVALEVRSTAGSIVRAPWTHGTVSPGETRRVIVDIRAPVRPLRAGRDTVTARATTDTAAAEAGYQFDVVPAGRNAGPPRNALPTALAIRFGSRRDPGFGSFVGSGALDRDRQVMTTFSLATRDRSNPLLLERDEYVVNVSARAADSRSAITSGRCPS